MKILKEFEDKQYYHSTGVRPVGVIQSDATWFWGLGEDGQLYYRFVPNDFPGKWYSYQTHAEHLPMSIAQMKKIVSEFGHLLVFL